MEKTSKITRLEYKSAWTNPSTQQTIHYHSIWLENGDIGQIGAMEKEPAFLKPGESLDYTIETTEKGSKIKRLQKPKNDFKRPFDPAAEERKQKMIARQSSLKLAFDYLSMQNKAFTPGDVMSLSDVFTDYVMK